MRIISLSGLAVAVAAAAATVTLAGGGAANAAVSLSVTTVTGVTPLTDNGDSGNGTVSTWAHDDFDRTLTVTSSLTACPTLYEGLTCYTATVADSGSFKAIVGHDAPNPDSVTDSGASITHAVTGSVKGSATYAFETAATPAASNIPATLDNGGAYQASGRTSTLDWFENAFPAAATFDNSAGVPLVNGEASDTALQDSWTWTYITREESWTDSYADNGGLGALDGNITGKIRATPAATLTASPTSVSFASQAIGSTSAAQTVTVKNTGTATASVSSISVTGPFAETSTCGSSIAAGASCTVGVTFAPAAAGSASGSLTVASDATDASLAVALTGTAPAPAVCVSSITGNSQANSTAPTGLTAKMDAATSSREDLTWDKPCDVTGAAWSTSISLRGHLMDTKVAIGTPGVFYGVLVAGDSYTVTTRWNDPNSPESSVTFTAA